MKTLILFALLICWEITAHADDFNGVYLDEADSSDFLVVTQKGATAVVTANEILSISSPAGTSTTVAFGIGTVSGSQMDAPQFYDTHMYCAYHITYSLSADGSTIFELVVGATTGWRGQSVGYNCSQNIGRTKTRFRVF